MGLENIFGKNYYEVKTKCKNCGSRQMTRIRKGNKPEDVLSRGKCVICGCFELEVDNK